jgi:hypothetical protein
MNKKNDLPYIGYAVGLAGMLGHIGNPLTSLTGIVTKLYQQNETQPSKTVDYIRVGALTVVALDFVFGLGGSLSSGKQFLETSIDAITMLSLYSDLKNYSATQTPIKDTFNDVANYFKK